MRSDRPPFRTVALAFAPVCVAVISILSLIATDGPADAYVVFLGVGATATTVVGSLILWRRPGHQLGRLLIAVGITNAVSIGLRLGATAADPFAFRFGGWTQAAMAIADILSTVALLVGSLIVTVRFPSGRTTTRLGRAIELLGVLVIVVVTVSVLFPDLASVLETGGVVGFIPYPLVAVDVAVRYRRADSLERTQFRWLIAAASVSAGLVLLLLPFGNEFEWLWTAWIASTVLPTLAIGIAVLRYRLYDIDRIVSRTISYGLVTALLFGLFLGTNLALQSTLTLATDADPLIVAASTLVVAALFQPLRRRIQAVVDRRFTELDMTRTGRSRRSPGGCAISSIC